LAHQNKVVRSIESPCGTRCVDIVRRPDGAFAHAENRRDSEDPTGWRPVGAEPAGTCPTEAAALADARRLIGWLRVVEQ